MMKRHTELFGQCAEQAAFDAEIERRRGHIAEALAAFAHAEEIYRANDSDFWVDSMQARQGRVLYENPKQRQRALQMIRGALASFDARGDLDAAGEIREWLTSKSGQLTP